MEKSDSKSLKGKQTPGFHERVLSQYEQDILDSVGPESDEKKFVPPNQTNNVTRAWVTQTNGFNSNSSRNSVTQIEALNSGNNITMPENQHETENLSPTQGITPITTGRLHQPNENYERSITSVGEDPVTPI